MTLHQAGLFASRRDQARIDPDALETYLAGDVDLRDGLALDPEIVPSLRRQAIAMDGAGKWQRAVDLVLGLSALGSVHPVDPVILARALLALGDPDGARASLSCGERLCRAMDLAPLGRDESSTLLGVLVDQLDDVSVSEAREAWEEARRLSSAVESFRALCARRQRGSDAEAVSAAIRAAGASSAVSKFPTAQLSLISSRTASNTSDDHLLGSDDVATLDDAAHAIGHLLGDGDLAAGLLRASARASDRAAFTANLGAFARMIDQAASAPSYAAARIGEHHPVDRAGYRAKRHAGIVGLLSEGRQEETQVEAVRIARATVDAPVPSAVLESMLVARFVREIGLHEKHAEPIRPKASAVRSAIAEELLCPLRALNETVHDMADRLGRFVELREAVNAIMHHVLEGDLETWRYGSDASRARLACLGKAQIDRWRAPRSTGPVRELDAIELFWSGKIGRATFAFDRSPEALLALVANGSSKMLVSGGARARAMILATERGAPHLVLGPVSGHGGDEARRTFVEHARERAEHLEVELAIPAELEAFAPGRRSVDNYVWEPSAGVVEVSAAEDRAWVCDARSVAPVGETIVVDHRRRR
jgi:hypothetical protein